MMGQIYGKATNVRAWLGEGDADNNYLFDFIKQRHDPGMRTSDLASIIHKNVRQTCTLLTKRTYWTRM